MLETLGPLVRRLGVVALLASMLGGPACSSVADAFPGASDDSAATATNPTDADSLGPTWQRPWNPPAAIPRRRLWERVVLLPGRIVSLPLSGVGVALNRVLLVLERKNLLAIGAPVGGAGPPSAGVRLKTPQVGDRAGLGAAIEAFAQVFDGRLRARVLGGYSGTLHQYGRTDFSITGDPAQLAYAYEWRPEERFYGTGMRAASAGRSGYASQTETVRGALRFGWNRTDGDSLPRTIASLWAGPRTAVMRSGREDGVATFDASFPGLGATLRDRAVDHLVYGGRVSNDTRQGRPHWTHGWRALFQAERFDDPVGAIALHSGSATGARFERYQLEGETGWSFWRDPRTVRVFVRVLDQNVARGADRFLISDMASLGGEAGLSGYEPERFHDLDLALGRVTYIVPVTRRVELDLHSEWGAVYHDVWADAKPSTLRNSNGFALRLRDDDKALASLGFDFSHEGVRLLYSLGATP